MSRLSKLVRKLTTSTDPTRLEALSASLDAALQNQLDMTAKIESVLSLLKSKEEEQICASHIENEPHGPEVPFSISKTAHGFMATHNADKIIGESIRLTGSFEEQHIEETINFLHESGFLVHKSIFIDIGANIGTHTIFALKNGFKKALCVEPDPDNFKLLRINQILNDVDSSCMNICAAASETAGSGHLETSPDNFGDNRVLSHVRPQDNVHAEQNWVVKDILKEKIDNIINLSKIDMNDIGLVWIDTQGHEGYVFGGGSALLKSPAPIVCEFWPYGLNRSGGYEMLRSALRASGRKVYDLRASLQQKTLVALNHDQMDTLFHQFLAQETPQASPHTDLLLLPTS